MSSYLILSSTEWLEQSRNPTHCPLNKRPPLCQPRVERTKRCLRLLFRYLCQLMNIFNPLLHFLADEHFLEFLSSQSSTNMSFTLHSHLHIIAKQLTCSINLLRSLDNKPGFLRFWVIAIAWANFGQMKPPFMQWHQPPDCGTILCKPHLCGTLHVLLQRVNNASGRHSIYRHCQWVTLSNSFLPPDKCTIT